MMTFDNNKNIIIIISAAIITALVFVVTSVGARSKNNIERKDTVTVNEVLNLKGTVMNLPERSVLLIGKKGKITNGTVVGSDSEMIVFSDSNVIGTDVRLSGKWANKTVSDKWFCFDARKDYISNRIIENILSLTNDQDTCHIKFEADRTYHVALTYNGPVNLGDMITYTVDAKKKILRRYSDLLLDKYAYTRLFTIPSNTHLTINNRIEMMATNMGTYYMFWEYDKENVRIDGHGTFAGDAKVHIYDTPFIKGHNYYGEWGHIFCCIACRKFTFEDVTLENAFGDCIYYEPDYYTSPPKGHFAHELVVDNVRIRSARRNGISLASKKARITNCTFENCGTDDIRGTAPMSAIDFEPDGLKECPEIGNEDVIMENCTFIGNKHDISSTYNTKKEYGKIATRVKNCIFTAPLRLNSAYWIEFDRCKIPDFTSHVGRIRAEEPVRFLSFKNCEIDRLPQLMMRSDWKNKFSRSNKIKTIYGEK